MNKNARDNLEKPGIKIKQDTVTLACGKCGFEWTFSRPATMGVPLTNMRGFCPKNCGGIAKEKSHV